VAPLKHRIIHNIHKEHHRTTKPAFHHSESLTRLKQLTTKFAWSALWCAHAI